MVRGTPTGRDASGRFTAPRVRRASDPGSPAGGPVQRTPVVAPRAPPAPAAPTVAADPVATAVGPAPGPLADPAPAADPAPTDDPASTGGTGTAPPQPTPSSSARAPDRGDAVAAAPAPAPSDAVGADRSSRARSRSRSPDPCGNWDFQAATDDRHGTTATDSRYAESSQGDARGGQSAGATRHPSSSTAGTTTRPGTPDDLALARKLLEAMLADHTPHNLHIAGTATAAALVTTGLHRAAADTVVALAIGCLTAPTTADVIDAGPNRAEPHHPTTPGWMRDGDDATSARRGGKARALPDTQWGGSSDGDGALPTHTPRSLGPGGPSRAQQPVFSPARASAHGDRPHAAHTPTPGSLLAALHQRAHDSGQRALSARDTAGVREMLIADGAAAAPGTGGRVVALDLPKSIIGTTTFTRLTMEYVCSYRRIQPNDRSLYGLVAYMRGVLTLPPDVAAAANDAADDAQNMWIALADSTPASDEDQFFATTTSPFDAFINTVFGFMGGAARHRAAHAAAVAPTQGPDETIRAYYERIVALLHVAPEAAVTVGAFVAGLFYSTADGPRRAQGPAVLQWRASMRTNSRTAQEQGATALRRWMTSVAPHLREIDEAGGSVAAPPVPAPRAAAAPVAAAVAPPAQDTAPAPLARFPAETRHPHGNTRAPRILCTSVKCNSTVHSPESCYKLHPELTPAHWRTGRGNMNAIRATGGQFAALADAHDAALAASDERTLNDASQPSATPANAARPNEQGRARQPARASVKQRRRDRAAARERARDSDDTPSTTDDTATSPPETSADNTDDTPADTAPARARDETRAARSAARRRAATRRAATRADQAETRSRMRRVATRFARTTTGDDTCVTGCARRSDRGPAADPQRCNNITILLDCGAAPTLVTPALVTALGATQSPLVEPIVLSCDALFGEAGQTMTATHETSLTLTLPTGLCINITSALVVQIRGYDVILGREFVAPAVRAGPSVTYDEALATTDSSGTDDDDGVHPAARRWLAHRVLSTASVNAISVGADAAQNHRVFYAREPGDPEGDGHDIVGRGADADRDAWFDDDGRAVDAGGAPGFEIEAGSTRAVQLYPGRDDSPLVQVGTKFGPHNVRNYHEILERILVALRRVYELETNGVTSAIDPIEYRLLPGESAAWQNAYPDRSGRASIMHEQRVKREAAGALEHVPAGTFCKSPLRMVVPSMLAFNPTTLKYRLVHDLRLANAVTDRSTFPRPRPVNIDEAHGIVARMTMFSIIDLQSAFDRLPLADGPDLLELYTVIQGEMYRLRRAPMGQTASMAYLQQAVDRTLEGVQHATINDPNGVLPYADDNAIGTNGAPVDGFYDAEPYAQHTIAVLEGCVRNNMKCGIGKVALFMANGGWLGKECGGGKIALAATHLDRIAHLEFPTTAAQLASRVAILNYLARHAKGLSILTSRFNSLASTKGPLAAAISRAGYDMDELRVDWAAAVKTIVDAEPLHAYDPQLPLHLYTDCSKRGIGGHLCQPGPDGAVRTLGYTSRRLRECETLYYPGMLESLAMIHCLERFGSLTHTGRQVLVYVDHKALAPVLNPDARDYPLLWRRWAHRLATDWDIVVRHVPGTEQTMIFSDALSRAFADEPPAPGTTVQGTTGASDTTLPHGRIPVTGGRGGDEVNGIEKHNTFSSSEIPTATIGTITTRRGPLRTSISSGAATGAQGAQGGTRATRRSQREPRRGRETATRNDVVMGREITAAESRTWAAVTSGVPRARPQRGPTPAATADKTTHDNEPSDTQIRMATEKADSAAKAKDVGISREGLLVFPADLANFDPTGPCTDPGATLHETALTQAHRETHASAASTAKTVIERGFGWSGIFAQAAKTVRACPDCAMVNEPQGLWVPTEPTAYSALGPGEHVCIDLFYVDSHPEAAGVLIVVCAATGYVSCYPVKAKTGADVAERLIEHFLVHGPAAQVSSDQGPEFRCSLTQDMRRQLGVLWTHSTPYRPQSNAIAERHVKVILDKLRSIAHARPSKWLELTQVATYMHNTAAGAVTGRSPFFLYFARVPRQFAPFEELPPIGEWSEEGHVARMTKNLVLARGVITAKVERRTAARTAREANAKPSRVEVGTWVRASDPGRRGTTSKIAQRAHGPYQVLAVLDGGKSYQLATRDGTPIETRFAAGRLGPVPEPQDGDAEFYECERIVGQRTAPDGTIEYHVKWRGCPNSANSWEPTASFVDEHPIHVWNQRHYKRRRIEPRDATMPGLGVTVRHTPRVRTQAATAR
jgi:hypothetical protein